MEKGTAQSIHHMVWMDFPFWARDAALGAAQTAEAPRTTASTASVKEGLQKIVGGHAWPPDVGYQHVPASSPVHGAALPRPAQRGRDAQTHSFKDVAEFLGCSRRLRTSRKATSRTLAPLQSTGIASRVTAGASRKSFRRRRGFGSASQTHPEQISASATRATKPWNGCTHVSHMTEGAACVRSHCCTALQQRTQGPM